MSFSSANGFDSSSFNTSSDDSAKASDSGDTTHTSPSSSTPPSPASNTRKTPKIPISELEWECRATQTTIRHDLVQEGEPLSIDAEFQRYKKVGELKWHHRFGRVAVVNSKCQTVWEAFFAYPNQKDIIKNCHGERFGVEPPDFLFKNGALPARKAEADLKALMKNHPIIVHDKSGDTKAFYFPENQDAFSASNGVVVHDTQEIYSYLRSSGQPGLAYASEVVLGKEIQKGGFHTPVEDAKATMELYLLKYPYDRDAEAAKRASKKPSLAPHLRYVRGGGRFVQKSKMTAQ